MNFSDSSCRGLAVAGIVCGGVSLVVFGALLDIVGFVIGLVAFMGARKLSAEHPENAVAQNALRLSKIAMIVCLLAGIANFLTALFLYPMLMQTMASAPSSIF